MNDADCVRLLQQMLPRLHLRWPGFRKVRKQVCKRIGRRVRELGLADADAYAVYLATHPAEWRTLDALCRISISRFYRDRAVYDALRDIVLPERAAATARRGDNAIDVWSAGCASGEEPYTLTLMWAMRPAGQFPGIDLRVTATDADARLLARAARGVYPRGCLRELPDGSIADAFEECGDEYRIRPKYRSGVTFIRQDIRAESPAGLFDLVLCRNLVFTYFDAAQQESVLARLADHLRVGGYLVIGKHESLPAAAPEFAPIDRALPIYQRLPGSAVPTSDNRWRAITRVPYLGLADLGQNGPR